MVQSVKSGSLHDDNAAGDLKSDFARLKADFKILKDDIAAMGAARAGEAKTNLKEGLVNAEDQAREAIDVASSELQEIQKQAEKAVKKKPLTAVAAALAIGYFIGGIARK
ncbi:MAG: DUF883 family protein [Marinicaulis sp.]|nr:DUF883 family protein [Marinicaulis sp.]